MALHKKMRNGGGQQKNIYHCWQGLVPGETKDIWPKRLSKDLSSSNHQFSGDMLVFMGGGYTKPHRKKRNVWSFEMMICRTQITLNLGTLVNPKRLQLHTATNYLNWHTVDGWNPANQLRLVVYPIVYRVSAPSQVVVWDFSHQQ